MNWDFGVVQKSDLIKGKYKTNVSHNIFGEKVKYFFLFTSFECKDLLLLMHSQQVCLSWIMQ